MGYIREPYRFSPPVERDAFEEAVEELFVDLFPDYDQLYQPEDAGEERYWRGVRDASGAVPLRHDLYVETDDLSHVDTFTVRHGRVLPLYRFSEKREQVRTFTRQLYAALDRD